MVGVRCWKDWLDVTVAHGMVHLCGWTHENEGEWKEMKRVEERVVGRMWEQQGIADKATGILSGYMGEWPG